MAIVAVAEKKEMVEEGDEGDEEGKDQVDFGGDIESSSSKDSDDSRDSTSRSSSSGGDDDDEGGHDINMLDLEDSLATKGGRDGGQGGVGDDDYLQVLRAQIWSLEDVVVRLRQRRSDDRDLFCKYYATSKRERSDRYGEGFSPKRER